jgi:hypothetical protein
MALMVYGKYGRSGVYEMQRALKMVIGDEVCFQMECDSHEIDRNSWET